MKFSGRTLDELTDPMHRPQRRLHILTMVGVLFVSLIIFILSWFHHGYHEQRKAEDDYLRKMRRNRSHRLSPQNKRSH
jgi:heme/copper-type cytochrome/quinol oxidase subunit 2